jgi:hypothetical protein
MQKLTLWTPFMAFGLLACGLFTPASSPTVVPTVTITQVVTEIPLATLTPVPTATEIPPSPTPEITISIPDPKWSAYDFVDNICQAEWANSIGYLPTCPGDLDNIAPGYVTQTELVFAESTTGIEAPALIVLPQQGATNTAIFGMYPAFDVWSGDQFRATIACQGDSTCDVEFALEYFDAAEEYQVPGWKWKHQAGDGPIDIAVDLSSLAGQTVRFILALRSPQGDPADDHALWIAPHIYRSPEAQPPSDQADQTPGVISGLVEMSTAPPYMNDPGKSSSTPVVVVFFNLDDGTYWWIHTSLTGHPYFQMTVPPGSYHVIAYGQGVGDVHYVPAGYTGQNPSCGQALQSVIVEPNAEVENIIIADWNWMCSGDAYRPEKPADIPLP